MLLVTHETNYPFSTLQFRLWLTCWMLKLIICHLFFTELGWFRCFLSFYLVVELTVSTEKTDEGRSQDIVYSVYSRVTGIIGKTRTILSLKIEEISKKHNDAFRETKRQTKCGEFRTRTSITTRKGSTSLSLVKAVQDIYLKIWRTRGRLKSIRPLKEW
jgi:hypothetical protein